MTEWPGGAAGILDGVAWGHLDTHADERGAFRELWRAGASPERFVQANLSTSAARVLRGLHYHRRQLDRWTVARGRAFVALVDVRPLLAEAAGAGQGSGQVAGPEATVQPLAAETRVETRVLGPDEWVAIPSGVAHGFYALEPTDLLYFVTNEYDGTDELGFAWNDPEVGVPWPDPDPILSPRDRSNPSLRELVRSLR
ncbi:MAG: dTDP-4-dehydrorhamnose 3,5-epimerase family protein [Candidatus Limnocylindrales bacterium]